MARKGNANKGLSLSILKKGKCSPDYCTHMIRDVDKAYFKVFIHSINEPPDVNGKFIKLYPGVNTTLQMKTKFVVSSKNLNDVNLKRRNCFFKNEKVLRFFRYYTQKNCQLECYSNNTKRNCGCVHFSMVHDRLTKICDSEQSLKCLNGIRKKYKSLDMDNEIGAEARDFLTDCKCLPTCDSVEYTIHSKTEIKDFELTEYPRTSLEITFEDDRAQIYERKDNFNWKDLMASCGGLIGIKFNITEHNIRISFFILQDYF